LFLLEEGFCDFTLLGVRHIPRTHQSILLTVVIITARTSMTPMAKSVTAIVTNPAKTQSSMRGSRLLFSVFAFCGLDRRAYGAGAVEDTGTSGRLARP